MQGSGMNQPLSFVAFCFVYMAIGLLVGHGWCHDVPRYYDNLKTQSTCKDECSKCYSCCMAECVGSSKYSHTSCMTLTQVSQALWDSDTTNRLTQSDITLDYQTKISRGNTKDRAPNKLFSKVDESKFDTPTYRAFFRLLDNYEPTKGIAESESSEEMNEVDNFLDVVLDTKVMDMLFNYLKCQGSVTSKSGLKAVLNKLWFQLYNRSPKYDDLDTSGFEHVMVGEYKNSYSVNGFHSWLSFYNEEKKGNLNYLGHIEQGDPDILVTAFTWNGHIKTLTSFFVGVSPEFDLAIYTLCFLQSGKCQLILGGHDVFVQTYDKDGHVATAYISVKIS